MPKTLAVKENNMSSKFSIPFLKKSPLPVGAYEAAVDGKAFMGGVVTGEEQFAKLQTDLVKAFEKATEPHTKCPAGKTFNKEEEKCVKDDKNTDDNTTSEDDASK